QTYLPLFCGAEEAAGGAGRSNSGKDCWRAKIGARRETIMTSLATARPAGAPSSEASVARVDMKLEVHIIPVSDVERSNSSTNAWVGDSTPTTTFWCSPVGGSRRWSTRTETRYKSWKAMGQRIDVCQLLA